MLTRYKQKQNAIVVPSDLLKAHTLWKYFPKFTYSHFWQTTVHHLTYGWVWFSLYSSGKLQSELLGMTAFPHRAWGLSVILTDMSFHCGKKKYQIGSPDKSWQTNQKHTEIRLFNLRTVSHSDWQALQVTPCQPAKGMSASDHNSWERKSNWFSLLMFLMTHFQLKV